MQDIHSIGGGRFLGGGGGGDRRLRPHLHQQQNHQQALKCPRCDSVNTKFCYYNNYNLSQPRHFCKNCRRYWTKGGILRNVPVGGGSRKSKRSNKPKNNSSNNSSSSSETVAATTSTSQPPPPEPERKSNSHSSSESSSLTAAAAATEAMSAPTSNVASSTKLLLDKNVHESKLFLHQSTNPGFELDQGGLACGIFSEIGSFTSLMASNEALAFGFGNNIPDASSLRFSATNASQQGSDQLSVVTGGTQHDQCQWQEPKFAGFSNDHHHQGFVAGSLLDHTVPLELSSLQNKTGHGGFGSLDWHTVADQGLLDLPSTVDQAYWNHTHWSDQDNPNLFHLP